MLSVPPPQPGLSADVKSEGISNGADNLSTTISKEYAVFEKNSRRCIVLFCALAGFFSPFSAFTYFPALDNIGNDLGVSLQLMPMDLTVTMFLVIQGIAPAILGDLADQIGRRPV